MYPAFGRVIIIGPSDTALSLSWYNELALYPKLQKDTLRFNRHLKQHERSAMVRKIEKSSNCIVMVPKSMLKSFLSPETKGKKVSAAVV